MMILGALIVAAGVGLAYLPAGIIVLGVFLVAGGYFKARLGRSKSATQ